jgi:hypothetical protein
MSADQAARQTQDYPWTQAVRPSLGRPRPTNDTKYYQPSTKDSCRSKDYGRQPALVAIF